MSMNTTAVPPPLPLSPPWGFWMTLVWGVVAFVTGAVVAFPAGYAILGGRLTGGMDDGVQLSVIMGVSLTVQTSVVLLAARWRRWPVADYLGLVAPRGRRDLLVALICLVVVGVALSLFAIAAGRDMVSPFQIKTYTSAKAEGWLAALIFVIVVVAPVGEEILFRGFLYRGWAKPGYEIYAIIGITILFAAGHIQYDWVGITQVAVIGLVFGWFRWATGSTLLTIVMHILVNLESVIETVIKVEFLS